MATVATTPAARERQAVSPAPFLPPPTLLKMLLGCIGIVLLGEAVRLIALHGFGHGWMFGISQKLNIAGEANVATWFSTAQLLLAGVLALLIFAERREAVDSLAAYWAGLGAIMLYMSMDEAISIHEMLNDPLRERFELGDALYFPWVIAGAAVVLLVPLVYLRFLRALPRRTAGLMILSGAMFVTGALGLELLEGPIEERGETGTLVFWVLTTLEEVLELSGIAVFIFCLTEYASRYCRRLGSIFGPPS